MNQSEPPTSQVNGATGTAETSARVDEFTRVVSSGTDQLRSQHPEAAIAPLRKALELEPGNLRVVAMLGLAYFRAGQLREAQGVYQSLVARAPTDAVHRLNLGLVYLKLGNAALAIEMLEASRSIDPSSGRAVHFLGLAYARAGRFVDAYRALLLAGQRDLASEIQQQLTVEQQQAIRHDLPRRVGSGLTEPPLSLATDSRPSDSLRFVRPSVPSMDSPLSDGTVAITQSPPNAISMAVAQALPSAIAAHSTLSMAPGYQVLGRYATAQLMRPMEQLHSLELIEHHLLSVRVSDKLYCRQDGAIVTGGALAFEAATRRVRGQQTAEPFVVDGQQMWAVTGTGYLVVEPGVGMMAVVLLDDDILYLREDTVFAFESGLRWENGNVPGLRGRVGIVQFRGDGAVAFKTKRSLYRMKLAADVSCVVPLDRLAGWIGRVVPRAFAAVNGEEVTAIECSGEGVLLLESHNEKSPTQG